MIVIDAKVSRRHIFYQGHVQGVGFRYTVCRVASGIEVTGYVRNLPDGRVEMVAEGAIDQIQQLLKGVEEAMAGHIRHTDVHTTAATGEFSRFEIRH